jgi:uncharacterized protein YkwD
LFKQYFIPHEKNDHQPKILRKRAILTILTIVFFVELVFLFQILFLFPMTGLFSSVIPSVLVDFTNADRQQHNASPLKANPILALAAQQKANDMAQKGYFSHQSPDGKTPWYWLSQAGYNYIVAGENLAVNFSDSNDIENAWMNSPGHRANILNNNFTEIGVAAADGFYNGKPTVFVVQFFGRPSGETKVAQISPSPSQATELSPSPAPVKIIPVSSISPSPMQTPKVLISALPSPSQTATPPIVAGQSSSTNATSSQDLLVFVQEENKNSTGTAATGNVAGSFANNQPSNKSSFFQKALTMPRALTNLIYLILAGIISLALILKIFIKIKIQYPKLIFSGVITLFFIISLLLLNTFLTQNGAIF